MIRASELRLGNYILFKSGVRILPVKCSFQHFDLLSKGEKQIFPVVLKADILEKCGFVENKKYPLLPAAREFVKPIAVIGNGDTELRAYIKNNQECFARAAVSNVPVSNNVFQLHQLQNLYYALTATELEIML